MICQVSRFIRPVGLQIFQDEERFHSAGRENGPSVSVGHFLGQSNEALLVLKDLQPNRPDKATYLTNHKKTGLAIFRKKKKLLGWSMVNIKEKAV